MKRKKNRYILFVISSLFLFVVLLVDNINGIVLENKIQSFIIKDPEGMKYNYLEIPTLQLKQIIIKGMNQKNLDKNYITTNDDISSDHSITLAGHNVKSVFGKLHHIKIDDIIYINKDKKYKVISKKIIEETEIDKLKIDKNSLNLITCTIYPKKRLLVSAKLQD